MSDEDEEYCEATRETGMVISVSGPYPLCSECRIGRILPKYSNDEYGEDLYWKCSHCGKRT